MGAFKIMSTGTANEPASEPRPSGNPNPYRFTVMGVSYVGGHAVVEVMYPDCTNYEGRKILVFKSKEAFDKQWKAGALDPHFVDGPDSPIARFAPTKEGWLLAKKLAELLPKEEKK